MMCIHNSECLQITQLNSILNIHESTWVVVNRPTHKNMINYSLWVSESAKQACILLLQIMILGGSDVSLRYLLCPT